MASGASGTDLLLNASHFATASGLATSRMSGVAVSTMTRPSTSSGQVRAKSVATSAPVGMGDEHVGAGFARGLSS